MPYKQLPCRCCKSEGGVACMFPGVPGDLVNYLYVAEEVRGMLAQLGYDKLDDVIGRTELLKARDISLVKTQHLDLGYVLSSVGLPKLSSTEISKQNVHTNCPVLDDVLLSDPEIADAIENEKVVEKSVKICNVDQAVCRRVAGAVAKKYGDTGFAGQLNITFNGSAGQSFACFLTPVMNIRLVGEGNDYVGKVNREIVKIQRVTAPVGQMQLKSLIEAHVEKTASGKGSAILKEWDEYLPLFRQLVPPSEEDTPEVSALYERTTADQSALQSA